MSDCYCTYKLLDTIHNLLKEQGDRIMALQDDLTGVRDDLSEASTEIVAKLEQLEQQVRDGSVDPALVTEIKDTAQRLANVVPDAAPEEPPVEEPPVDPNLPLRPATRLSGRSPFV